MRLDAFDTWALRKILRIPNTRHVSNAEVRRTTGCSPLSHLVTNRRLRLFGHIACSSSHEDHHRALAAAIRQVPSDWKLPIGRPCHTWLHAIEADLGPLNFGLATAWRKATTRDEWQRTVDTATLQRSTLWKKEKKRRCRSLLRQIIQITFNSINTHLQFLNHCTFSFCFILLDLLGVGKGLDQNCCCFNSKQCITPCLQDTPCPQKTKPKFFNHNFR